VIFIPQQLANEAQSIKVISEELLNEKPFLLFLFTFLKKILDKSIYIIIEILINCRTINNKQYVINNNF